MRDLAEVQEVRPDDRVPDGVALPQLDLDPLAERREHLGEDDLLVPHRPVGVLLDAGAAGQPGEADLHVGVGQVARLPAEGVLQVGHDGGVHPGQPVGAVDAHDVLGALALRRDAVGEEQVAAVGRAKSQKK